MNFGEVLARAWQIIWKHKILWVFGILAGFAGSTTGAGIPSGNNGVRYTFNPPSLSGQGQQLLFELQHLIESLPFWFWILGGLLLVGLFLLFIFLGTMGRIGLIHGTALVDGGALTLPLTDLATTSLPYFWRVFLLNLLVGVAAAVLVILLILPAILFGVITLGVGFICLACLAVPVGWFISLVVQQINVAIVVEDKGIFAGIERGWQVVTQNLGPMIVMALILYIGGAILSFLIGVPAALVFIPAVGAALTGATRVLVGGLILSFLLLLVYLPVLFVAGGILRAYLETAWTLTFLRLTHRPESTVVETAAEM